MRVVQVNLDSSIKVSAELKEAIREGKIDVASVHEPYVWDRKVQRLGEGRLFYSKGWSKRPWANAVVY